MKPHVVKNTTHIYTYKIFFVYVFLNVFLYFLMFQWLLLICYIYKVFSKSFGYASLFFCAYSLCVCYKIVWFYVIYVLLLPDLNTCSSNVSIQFVSMFACVVGREIMFVVLKLAGNRFLFFLFVCTLELPCFKQTMITSVMLGFKLYKQVLTQLSTVL